MVLEQCPRCNIVFSRMPGAGNTDFDHDCNSGNPTLDNEDVFKLPNQIQWNYQGVINQLSVVPKIHGADFDGVTKRGFRKTSFTQENHFEHIKFNKEEC